MKKKIIKNLKHNYTKKFYKFIKNKILTKRK